MSEGVYVYGVVGKSRLPSRLADRGLRLVRSGSVAAVVAQLPESPVGPTRRNLLAHADIVEDAYAWTTILPMRFGVVLSDEASVRESVLDANRELLEQLLARHAETAELSLKASYDEDVVLTELVAASPRLARLRHQYRSAQTMDVGIALGEAVAAELRARRVRDAARVLDTLVPLALEARAGDVSAPNSVVNLSFLVERQRVGDFEAALEQVSGDLSPPVHFKLVGPLPPYSFVDVPLAVAA
jgi:Gas vesicle synthesis protein GvpL/GvpF